ncbi:MAG: ABC transporter substrate-binding protein [Motiliproteus sp.]
MKKIIIVMLFNMIALQAFAAVQPKVRVAVLNFGTVNWEIDVIRHHKLDQKYNVSLDVMPVAGKNAAAVAMQGGAVDIIYSDWVWVNRQRHNGKAYSFSAVSAATGGVFVQADSSVRSIIDFKGERFGVAGGPVDKSWLILQAYSKRALGMDFQSQVEPVFAAPPLLNKLMYDGKLPAVINFWHYSARLRAQGFRPVIQVSEILENLGLESSLPVVGWVFDEQWARTNHEAISGFLQASKEARKILRNSDAEWERIRPLLHAENEQIFRELRDRYRQGAVQEISPDHLQSLAKLYAILAQEGGKKLTGGASTLDLSGFWTAPLNEVSAARLQDRQRGVQQ